VGTSEGTTLFDLGDRDEPDGSTDTRVVDPDSPRNWASSAFDSSDGAPNNGDLTSNQTFVRDPGTPPAGEGSLRYTIDDNSNRVEQFRTAQYDGRLLRDLRNVRYSTFQRPKGNNTQAQQPVYLRLNVSTDGDQTMEEQLYFIPANNGAQQAIEQSTWQNWDTHGGTWNVNGDPGTGPTSLDEYLAQHPDAVIVNNGASGNASGGVDFQVGSGGDNQRNGEYFLDNLKFTWAEGTPIVNTRNTDAFDLEPIYPSISVGNATATEVNSGTTPMTFTVTIDKAQDEALQVPFDTVESSATAPSDYATQSGGSVTIPAHATTATVTVDVASDMVQEPTEQLKLVLETPEFGTVGDGIGVGSITDNDTATGVTLANGRRHRITASVDTTPVAPHKPVQIIGGQAGQGTSVLFNGTLNDQGRMSKLLTQNYSKGAQVQVRAKVFTAEGTYKSDWMTIKVD
jgi:hypothetical protein